jgi:hypothetical protein
MYENDKELAQMLESAALPVDTPPSRVQAVHEQVMKISATGRHLSGTPRNLAVAALLVVGLTAVGLAATETGRDWVRSLFTPIQQAHLISGEHGNGSSWSVIRSGPAAGPFSAAEAEGIKTTMEEVVALKAAGEGRLVQMLETPGIPGMLGSEKMLVVCLIEYTLASGEKTIIGEQPNPAQVARMRFDEITKLRDAGEGEIISQADFPMGLGNYVIRLTLPDGEVVDVATIYPPGTRAEREAIFAEIGKLREARQFAVLNAERAPAEPVSGLLRYTLADGRVVGVAESVPEDVISDDGKYVVMPQARESTEIRIQSGQ